MSKLIHINESSFNRILVSEEDENKKELPFQTFYEEVLKFIKGLLNDPIGTKPSEILRDYGLHNGILRKKLLDYDVIKKDEDIREPYDETDGRQESRYYVKYSVPRENFKDKLRKVHSSLTSIQEAYHTHKGLMLHNNELCNDLKMRGEIDTMLASPLTMGVNSSEDAPEYVKQATGIYNNKIKNRKI